MKQILSTIHQKQVAPIKKMHAGASGCHSAIYASTSEVITPSSAQSTAKNAHAIHSGSSAPREAMKSSMHGDTSESCCDVQCQCPTGVCATVYAVINNELSVAVIAPTPLVVFVNHQTPYTIPNTQFRPKIHFRRIVVSGGSV